MIQKEHSFISHLRKDARISLAVISQEEKIPLSTTYDKIHRLQRDNVIKKFTALIDFSKLGYNYHAKLALSVPKKQKTELLIFLQKHSCLNSIFEINNGFDFFIETVHKDIKEYLAFIEGLQDCFDILQLQQYQVIEEIEKEMFLR